MLGNCEKIRKSKMENSWQKVCYGSLKCVLKK
jgi:hypothetical protein